QTLSVLVTPGTPALLPTVEVRDPSGGVLGTGAAAAAGQKALLNTAPAAASGVYTVNVGSVGGTTGSYIVRVILNAALEAESNDGAPNNTRPTAQDLTGSF